MKKIKFLIAVLSFAAVYFSACDFSSSDDNSAKSEKQKLVSVVCWNAQTFFDGTVEGTEYSDYQNLAKWSKDKYLTRLARLCEVMTSLNPDIFILEEIEDAAVVQDIANQLAGNSWDRSKNWNYACFGKSSGSAIGCAVFSKFELQGLKLHSMDIRTQSEQQPSSRPLIQVTADIDGTSLVIFVNHWKSKSGGEEASEIWRDWQESVLVQALLQVQTEAPEMTCLLCGDFNRDADEFVCQRTQVNGQKMNVLLRGLQGTRGVYSPWFNSDGSYTLETGSYYYDGQWERIDHIFITGGEISSFCVKKDGPWANSEGIPNGYKLYTGEGYSDHLPIMAIVSLN